MHEPAPDPRQWELDVAPGDTPAAPGSAGPSGRPRREPVPPAPASNPDLPPTTAFAPEPGDHRYEAWKLVERVQSGDAEAFGLVYDRYVDVVFRFIYFRTGNRPLAEDL